jgi:hypothetical protein
MKRIFGAVVRTPAHTCLWLISIWLLVCTGLSAQNGVVFEAKTESTEVAQGSLFELTFELKNAEGNRFSPPSFKGFRVMGGPSEMRGMSIINGKSSTQQSWSYQIEASQVGTFIIPSASVVVKGNILQTKPLTIRVLPARQSSGQRLNAPPPGSNGELFIAAELDRNTAYPGQQVTWRIKLYTLVSIEGADLIGLPDFKGFYAKEKRRFDTRTQYATLRGRKYAVKVIHEQALFPQETGELEIGVARVRAGVEQSGAFGAFIGPRPVMLQTEPLTLTVKPLPEPVPALFCGGVGKYEWEIRVDKDSLSTDDALTITASIRGDGDARRFAAPKLELPAELEGFEPKVKEEEEYENGEALVHTKVLEYVVLPKKPGDYTFTPTLSFFDPDSNGYRNFSSTAPVTIHVTAGKNYAAQQSIADSLANQTPIAPVKPNFWQQIGVWKQVLFFVGIFGLLTLIGFILFRKKRQYPSGQSEKGSVLSSPPMPSKSARAHLADAGRLLHGADSRAFYDALFKSLQGFLITKLGIPLAQLTPDAVRTRLRSRNVSATKIQQLITVWESCEQAIFSGQVQDGQKEAIWQQAQDVVHLLDHDLRD